MKLNIKNYPNVLEYFDSTRVGDNRVMNKGEFYGDGITYLDELKSKQLIFTKLFGSENVICRPEKRYIDLNENLDGDVSSRIKLDALIFGNQAVEYKKLKYYYCRGNEDDYFLKKLFKRNEENLHKNPLTGKTNSCDSVPGDISKLMLLGDDFDKYVILEVWFNEVITSTIDSYVEDLKSNIERRYNLVSYEQEKFTGLNKTCNKCYILKFEVEELTNG